MLSVFTVGVTLQLADHVSAGLSTINGWLLKTQSNSDAFQEKLKAVHGQMMMLQSVSNIGSNIFSASKGFLEQGYDSAKEYTDILTQMNLKGIEQAEIQKHIASAVQTSGQVITSTYTENLRILNDFMTILGKDPRHMSEARELLPEFQKSAAILRASADSPEAAAHADMESVAMLKSIEMTGQYQTLDQMRHHIHKMTEVATATGGRVKPSDYQNMLKYARQAKLTLDDNFLYNVAPELIMEMKSGHGGAGGGGGPGAMIAAFFRLGVQGIINKATAGNLADLGLLKHPTLKTTTTGTQVTGHGGLVGSEILARNPDEWVQKILSPALHKRFPGLNDKELGMKIPTIFKGNQMAVALMGELWSKHNQFEKFKDIRTGEKPFEEQYKGALKSTRNVELAAAAQWKNLMVTVGTEILPTVVPLLKDFAQSLSQVGKFLNDNPAIRKGAVQAVVGAGIAGGLMNIGGQVGQLLLIVKLLGGWKEAATLVLGPFRAFLGLFGGLGGLFLRLGPMVGGILPALQAAGAGIATFIGAITPLGWIIIGVGVAITGLVAIVMNWNTICKFTTGIMHSLADAARAAGPALVGLLNNVLQFLHLPTIGAGQPVAPTATRPGDKPITPTAKTEPKHVVRTGQVDASINIGSMVFHQQPNQDPQKLAHEVHKVLNRTVNQHRRAITTGTGSAASVYSVGGSDH